MNIIEKAIEKAGGKRELAVALSNTATAKKRRQTYDHVRIGNWTAGRNKPSMEACLALAEYLDMAVSTVIDETLTNEASKA